MASIEIEGLLSAAPAAEPWPRNEPEGDSTLGLQADEMFARQLDTRFAGEVRGLVSDPATGLAGKDPEEALAGIAETTRLLSALKDRYLAQAIGPRQKAMLEPVIDRRLERAGGDLGRITEQATSVLDDQARADRAWQVARGRAATSALDWLGENPAAPLMAMPTELRDGLSPEQSDALDRTAMNGGRVVTDRDLYDRLDDQAVHEPERFTGLDLAQYRLSLGDNDYNRLTKLQKTLAEAEGLGAGCTRGLHPGNAEGAARPDPRRDGRAACRGV